MAGALPYAPAQQRRGIRSQRKLLLAAQAQFAEHGYAQTRISDIIARAGVSNGYFSHRFSDKASLFRAITQRYAAEAARQIEGFDTVPPPTARLPGCCATCPDGRTGGDQECRLLPRLA
ncbi:MAG: TetR/AcrR family transcriptional regulator [Pararhodobacter sp.]